MKNNNLLRPIKDLEGIIRHKFKDKGLLMTALTHSSYSNEIKHKQKIECNERLEFLGDSVLSLVTSDFLYSNYEGQDEGTLTRIRAIIVCENSLYEFAVDIGLGDFLLLGHGELLSQGRKRKSTLADAFEAVIAALYLDGGIAKTRQFLLPILKQAADKAVSGLIEDFKSLLQKIAQQTPEEILEYKMIKEEGPPHDRTFTFSVYLNANLLGTGTGPSKREAEQEAARRALILLGVIDDKI